MKDGNRATACGGRVRFLIVVMLCIVIPAIAAIHGMGQGGTTRYVYDDNKRLQAVISPNGEATIYEYDAVGNITAIRRNAANTLEILSFTPREGLPGTHVTIIGTGLGGGVSAVAFNGVAAQIVSANGPVLVVAVPVGATTGPIGVSTTGGTATTSRPFTVRGISLSPPAPSIISENNIQFTASVVVSGSPAIVWSVDGVESGNMAVGTITGVGLYTAPKLPAGVQTAIFRVRATSVSETEVYGEAIVTVRNREYIRPAFAAAVSVRNGNPSNAAPIYSVPVSARNGNPPSAAMLFSNQVSATTGPSIASITPMQIGRGASVSIAITGVNLTGAASLNFLTAASTAFDSGITVSNINVNGAGTSMTVTVTVAGGSALGRRVVAVVTPNGTSTLTDVGVNIIEIIP